MDYNAWARAYDDIFPLNEDTLNFLMKHLNGNIIADVGCGSGNYAKALAQKGFNVTGMDITKPLLELARKKTNELDNVTFREEDMRKLSDVDTYDSIFTIGNSLVHLLDIADIEAVFRSFYHALKSQGKLVVQIVNYDRIMDQKIESLPTLVGNTYSMKRKYKFNGGLVNFQTILKKNSQHFMNDVYLYPLRKDEFDALVKNVGFTSMEYFDGFTDNDFDKETSFSLVAVLKK